MTDSNQIQTLLDHISLSIKNKAELSTQDYQYIQLKLQSLVDTFFPLKVINQLSLPAQEVASQEKIQIWTDGACRGNPGPGGWAALLKIEDKMHEITGASRRTTNNIMEMTGALEALKSTAKGSQIVLTSDSQYLIKGITQWIHAWKQKNWLKSDGKPVLNRSIWQDLDQVSSERTIKWIWVKGHAGHPENERCDQLAREAIAQLS